MTYFSTLNLDREPFSNSPEPEFFYEASQHVQCLQQLEISIRLRRGLNVVIGDVGTGKTTLSRMLIRKLQDDSGIEFHLLLEPDFSGPIQFLAGIARMLGALENGPGLTEWQLKEAVKQVLYRRGVDENKTVVLIIDEGQKLPAFCIELLRELLNYETNQFKLLQIVIFAQPEFHAVLERWENFADRMNVCLRLRPLDFHQMRSMIAHRIDLASRSGKQPLTFTMPALGAIYLATGGVPRKVVMICHQVILAMLIRNRSSAGWSLTRSVIRGRAAHRRTKASLGWGMAALLGLAAIVAVSGWTLRKDLPERMPAAYQARIMDRTVYPLERAGIDALPLQPAAPGVPAKR